MKNRPNGADLLALLIQLYADQEGVKITFEITDDGDEGTPESVKAS